MVIYLDNEYKCHVTDDGTMRAVECDFFDSKCVEFVEGYIYDDRNSLVVYPWKPYAELEVIQNAVDRTQAEADEQIMGLLDTIEELIIGG